MKFIDKFKQHFKNDKDTNINFVFVRHGYGCHNAIGNLINNKLITSENGKQ